MRTIYDDIVEKEMKIDGEGRTVFFAKGLGKPGYILPNDEKKAEIKRIITKYSSFLMSVFMGSFFFMRKSFLSIVVVCSLIAVLYGWYRRKINKAVEGLQVSDLRPKLDPINIQIGICLIGVVTIFVMMSGIFLPIIIRSQGMEGIIISISIFFLVIVLTIAGIYFLIMKKKPEKDI